MVSDTPASKPMPAPRREPPKPIAKSSPTVAKATAKKTTIKPKTETKAKSGIEEALDGLE